MNQLEDIYGHCNKMNYDLNTLNLFWSNVNTLNGANNCWLWISKLSNCYNYETVNILGKQFKVHRFAYECYNGPLAKNLQLRHICGFKNCINPNHLLVGSYQRNINDDISRNKIKNILFKNIIILNDCWIFTDNNLYGQYNILQKKITAYELSYELYNGSIPINYHLQQTCNTHNCVNPNHFTLLYKNLN